MCAVLMRYEKLNLEYTFWDIIFCVHYGGTIFSVIFRRVYLIIRRVEISMKGFSMVRNSFVLE